MQQTGELRKASGLKMGVIAAASVFAGGIAAAWFYRKTLSQLRETDWRMRDTEVVSSRSESAEEF
jgi:hypothetical protein